MGYSQYHSSLLSNVMCSTRFWSNLHQTVKVHNYALHWILELFRQCGTFFKSSQRIKLVSNYIKYPCFVEKLRLILIHGLLTISFTERRTNCCTSHTVHIVNQLLSGWYHQRLIVNQHRYWSSATMQYYIVVI
jgi:hypothetical protein